MRKRERTVLNRQELESVSVVSEAPYGNPFPKALKMHTHLPPRTEGILQLPLDLRNVSVFVIILILLYE